MSGRVLKSCQFYGYALIQILIEPRLFFTELAEKTTLIKSLGFGVLCSLFFVSAILVITMVVQFFFVYSHYLAFYK